MSNPIDEVSRRLAGASMPASPKRISSDELRAWALEYLAEYDAEVARFPELDGQPHWNLWMIDQSISDALFAVIIFYADGMDFFCGTGDSYQVRKLSDVGHPKELFATMNEKLRIPEGVLVLDRRSAENWLGRGW